MKIGIIGCGHMGSALARAIFNKKLGRIYIGNPHKIKLFCAPAARKKLHWTVDNVQVAKNSDVIILAVKPGIVRTALQEISPHIQSRQILLSIAAGIPLKKLTAWSSHHKKIVRVMPNLAAEVGESISVWKSTKWLTEKEKHVIGKILNSFGKNIEVKEEKLIDMATPIGGGGPAYIAAVLESLARTAQKAGFTKEQARFLAIEAVDGSLDYIKETGIEFWALKKAVQTKGGTTEAGFKILKKHHWQKTLEKALWAGYKRAKFLAK